MSYQIRSNYLLSHRSNSNSSLPTIPPAMVTLALIIRTHALGNRDRHTHQVIAPQIVLMFIKAKQDNNRYKVSIQPTYLSAELPRRSRSRHMRRFACPQRSSSVTMSRPRITA